MAESHTNGKIPSLVHNITRKVTNKGRSPKSQQQLQLEQLLEQLTEEPLILLSEQILEAYKSSYLQLLTKTYDS